jgi:hypothetical protein
VRLTLALALLVATAAVADAYPQFRLSHEAACSACHLSPAGGGLLNDYGRDEAGSTISRGGDGRLLHGAWDPPSWLAIGGDFRFAFAGKYLTATDADFRGFVSDDHTPHADRSDLLLFPMQADLNLRLMKGEFAFAFTAGVRGVARDENAPVLLERFASREHYVSYTFGSRQLRLGRFFPVFGLRLPDHTAYVRRYMGLNTYEEPYALELAHYGEATDLHVTAFVPQPIELLGSGVRRAGGSVLLEHLWTDKILGGQARVAVGADDALITLGGVAKRWFMDAEVLVMAELDLQRQTFRGHGPGRTQIAGYLSASKWATRGVLVSSGVHLWEPDLTLRSTTRQAFEIAAQYFAWAHLELHLVLRASAQGGTVEDPSYLSLLQAHYYL